MNNISNATRTILKNIATALDAGGRVVIGSHANGLSGNGRVAYVNHNTALSLARHGLMASNDVNWVTTHTLTTLGRNAVA